MKNHQFLLLLFTVAALCLLILTSAVSAQTIPTTNKGVPYSPAAQLEKVSLPKPAGQPPLDICLLQDETGSFWDDIENLQLAAPALYDDINELYPDVQFAVAGFRDYPMPPCGCSSDWVYHLLSSMSPDKAAWLSGVNHLSAKGGYDRPEAQYDAIVAAADPRPFFDPRNGLQRGCGWRKGKAVRRLLFVSTDAAFQVPGPSRPHIHDHHSTLSILKAQNIMLVGLKRPPAGKELDALASATGGTVQKVKPDGSDIAAAILAALEKVANFS